MAALLKHYFNIAFLMARPQDLPAGVQQMQVGVALNFFTYVIALVGLLGLSASLTRAATDLALTAALLFLALVLTGRRARFEQAYGGLCGASAIVNLTALPLLNFGAPLPGEPISGLLQFSEFLLLVWSLSLAGHILRHTFEIRMSFSILLAFVYFLLFSMLVDALQGTAPADDQLSMYQSLAQVLS